MSYRLGLIGRNISYSLSPQIHEWGLRTLRLQGEYQIYDIAAEEIEPLLRKGEWDGLNVTVPYKTDVIRYCSRVTLTAQAARAANCVYREQDAIIGDNFDGAGFRFALNSLNNRERVLQSALIIGSGGAARAVAANLIADYPKLSITIVARNPEAARQLISLSERMAIVTVDEMKCTAIIYDLVVQATPIGSVNTPGLPLDGPLPITSDSLVMDSIYAPRKTDFLKQAEQRGARIMNGLPMLIGQAAASFTRWTGQIFPLEQAIRELMPKLERA